ncbi:aldo/keto reductase [uncultured Dokdonia sp.]|uniref:aldo/keto reductase n=1 Tax=uncultured Dokdonia sp. TaxID=575653 RepID=UPI00261842CA|nr:aldo/keto reductase [uncultured Dokdonia sp.]
MDKLNSTFKIGNLTEVNRMGFGTMRATTGNGIWGYPTDKASAIKVIRTAIENGVNFIDTADSYGPYTSELVVAEAIEPYKNEVVVATKGGAVKYKPGAIMANGHPYYLRTAIEGSLKRLDREKIEVYFLHRVDPNIPIEESVGALAKFQQEGKIKHIGISNVTIEQFEKAQKVAKIDVVQNAFSFQDRRHEELVKKLSEQNIAFMAHTPIAVNNWDDEILEQARKQNISVNQLSLSWLLNFSNNVIPIAGTSSEKHLLENLESININL